MLMGMPAQTVVWSSGCDNIDDRLKIIGIVLFRRMPIGSGCPYGSGNQPIETCSDIVDLCSSIICARILLLLFLFNTPGANIREGCPLENFQSLYQI